LGKGEGKANSRMGKGRVKSETKESRREISVQDLRSREAPNEWEKKEKVPSGEKFLLLKRYLGGGGIIMKWPKRVRKESTKRLAHIEAANTFRKGGKKKLHSVKKESQ